MSSKPKERGIVGSILVKIDDTGYTKVCPYCSCRYGETAALSGFERYVNLERCEACAAKYRLLSGRDKIKFQTRASV